MLRKSRQYRQVEEVLREVPEARSDDVVMIRSICERFYPESVKEIDGKKYYDESSLRKSASFRRKRRKIHEEGRYLPPEKVMRGRKEDEERIRSEYREEKTPKAFKDQYILF